MRVLQSWLILATVLLTASTAQAYQQVVTETGKVVAWPTDQVGFTIHQEIPPGWDQSTLEAIVLASKEPWESLECGSLNLEFQGWTFEGSPDLFDKKNGVYWIQEGWQFGSTLMAITLLEFSKFTGELRDADILVNNDQKTFDVDSFCDPTGLNYDLQNILTHEFGHFVGLNHSDDSEATMFADTFEEECAKRELHPDDEAGFCATYDRGDIISADASAEDIASGSEVDSGTSDGCGVRSGHSPHGPWLALFGLGLWMARQRRHLRC
tara:strand:- start:314 stop:1114 length:801 start_codon:yes stop_codon:yes gene_type:complete